MSELFWASMADLGRRIATKEVSPVEVVRAHLDRIAALDARLHAFITVCADAALESARAAEADLMAGRVAGTLHGVPWAPKDLYATKGVRTTGGSKILRDSVPPEDATVVARLGAAGEIVLGKLNMHEFAYGPEGLNAQYGDARNPWDADAHRIAGGSSSGSGVAVAAGLAPGSLGSDTGGSIRIPASLCGITGLKPTYGRGSRAGVLPLAWAIGHVGPMARGGRGCALLPRAVARAQDYQPDVRERLRVGAFVSGAHYVRGQQVRVLVRQEVDDALAKRAVLLAPATPIAAPVLGEPDTMLGDGPSDVRSALIRLTRPFNFSGHPGCAAPCGFTSGGLPIGLQIIGRPFDEATVLRVVDAYQRLTDWHTRRPAVA